MIVNINSKFIGSDISSKLDQANHIWVLNSNETNFFILYQFYKFLSEEEKNRLNKLVFLRDYIRFTISHIGLRLLLSFYLKKPLYRIKYQYSYYKKPYLASENNIFFNISHSEKQILIAISKYEVGVDIEYKRYLDFGGIMNLCFSSLEQEYISSKQGLKEKLDNFFKLWSRKEAISKAIGIGIMNKAVKEICTIKNIYTKNEKNIWQIVNLPYKIEYSRAIAYKNKHCLENQIYDWKKYEYTIINSALNIMDNS